jgi:hypothetical protein
LRDGEQITTDKVVLEPKLHGRKVKHEPEYVETRNVEIQQDSTLLNEQYSISNQNMPTPIVVPEEAYTRITK